MKNRITVLLATYLVACGVSGGKGQLEERPANKASSYEINSSRGSLKDIHVGMSESELLSLNHPGSRRSVVLEGDEYPVIDLKIGDNITLECLIATGKLYSFSTTAINVRDENNAGVGTSLSELKISYPKGKVAIGDEDGRYANFINGSRVVFQLDQSEIDRKCFDAPQSACAVDERTKVVKVVVN